MSFHIKGAQETHHEEKAFYGRTDHRNLEGIRDRSEEPGHLPEARNFGADVLPMAVEVRWDAGFRSETTTRSGSREPEIETATG